MIIKLHFRKSPVNEDIPINKEHGYFGAPRWYGTHEGLDYKAPRDSAVYAVEGGIVAYSGTKEGTEQRGNYGKTVVIHHTPKNMFSAQFRRFFPSVELEVNGKTVGRIPTGETAHELDVWG
jgi:hypothetical protein